MKVKKLHFVIDKTIKNTTFKNKIFKKYKNYSPKISEVIVVIGGDGFMLATLKKYQIYKIPFYGMNKGTFGFLMNKFEVNNLINRINKSKQVKILPLLMNAKTKNNYTNTNIYLENVCFIKTHIFTQFLYKIPLASIALWAGLWYKIPPLL